MRGWLLLSTLILSLGLTACSAPAASRTNWIELLSAPGSAGADSEGSGLAGQGPPAESFTAERLPIRRTPSARALLERYRYRNAAKLSGPSGLWPSLPLGAGIEIPDPRYPLRRALGLEFEPRYVQIREANALILRTERGSVVLPLDPDRPLGFPEDGTPEQRRARRAFLRDLDRDLRPLEPPAPDEPRVQP